MSQAPVFLLTMGDPAGIGAEIAVKALCDGTAGERPYRIAVVGDIDVLQKAADVCGLSPSFNIIEKPEDAEHGNLINAIDMREISVSQFTFGKPQASCGRAAYQYITKAINLTIEKKAAGVITNPISKESLKMAGIDYPGHTEIFADKTNTSDYSMVFLLDDVAVAHVTTHVSLRQAIDLITKDRVLRQMWLLRQSLNSLGIDTPRMAIGGLNPHAGENGLFGDEEKREIIPAIDEARLEGIDIVGPLPPDTVFNRAFKGEFNGVVSMLHDHGFVALKSRDFERGVNITIGLPIIRTSVGHGTAFDIAWKGEASPVSLLAAMDTAYKMYIYGAVSGG
ncbi:MAG: 4-hydroxythreonine-4-phosphate dehydrogenase PdxA [Chitinispirillales bacterium]|jgi:4-hydroxythreonine-4-phosphate dehydrogenase|nr:4-hydroxythreonine-4-phosphate dehydrogenase PdxA [Chitinispirillales bacterium]